MNEKELKRVRARLIERIETARRLIEEGGFADMATLRDQLELAQQDVADLELFLRKPD
jgi:hypothetical protein